MVATHENARACPDHESITDMARIDVGIETLRVHLAGSGVKPGLHFPCPPTEDPGKITWIGFQIFSRGELRWIHKYAYYHQATILFGGAHQAQVAREKSPW